MTPHWPEHGITFPKLTCRVQLEGIVLFPHVFFCRYIVEGQSFSKEYAK